MTDLSRKRTWTICCVVAVVVMVLAYTPLLLPNGPGGTLFGMPFTLWAGIALCIFMVILTFVATLVHPGRADEATVI